MKKAVFVMLLLAGMVATTATAKKNEKPFVVPELKEWQGGSGALRLRGPVQITVAPADAAQLMPVAERMAEDLGVMFDLDAQAREGRGGTLHLQLAACGTDNAEGYSIDIASRITVKANGAQGAFWATRTLLQILEQHGGTELPRGSMVDYPDYPVRAFMLDVGRKYIPIDFLYSYVDHMAYYKMNYFHIHLNDNSFPKFFGNDWDKTPAAFRLESDTYPGLASPQGYTKAEFIDLQKRAEASYVNILPEIDIPAHSLAFTHYRPSLGSQEYGMDHLDLFNPEVYTFFDALLKEYLGGDNPVFRGKQVHIGTDEYSNRDPKVVEKFREFTDHYIREVEKYGKQAVVWGALTHAKGSTPVKVDDVLMHVWYNGYAQPADMIELGYDVISIPDGYVYIVPAAGYYYDYLNCQYLYEHWTPARIGDKQFDEKHPQIKGGSFAVWNDIWGNGITCQDIYHRSFPAMQTLSQKMWSATLNSRPYAEFDSLRQRLSEGPGINVLGRLRETKGCILQRDTLRSGDTNDIYAVGFPYRVEFTVTASGNINGSTLFSGPYSTLYLRDPETGRISIEREDFRDSFNYEIPQGEAVTLAFEGDNQSVTLYVNGKLQDKLDKETRYYSQDHKSCIYYVNSFFFPLQKAGQFKGCITNLNVELK